LKERHKRVEARSRKMRQRLSTACEIRRTQSLSNRKSKKVKKLGSDRTGDRKPRGIGPKRGTVEEDGGDGRLVTKKNVRRWEGQGSRLRNGGGRGNKLKKGRHNGRDKNGRVRGVM